MMLCCDRGCWHHNKLQYFLESFCHMVDLAVCGGTPHPGKMSLRADWYDRQQPGATMRSKHVLHRCLPSVCKVHTSFCLVCSSTVDRHMLLSVDMAMGVRCVHACYYHAMLPAVSSDTTQGNTLLRGQEGYEGRSSPFFAVDSPVVDFSNSSQTTV